MRGKAARKEGKLAAIGDGSRGGARGRKALVVQTARQAAETFLVQDLPDGGGAQGSLLGAERRLDVVDGEVLFAHAEDEFADGVFFGLGMRAVFELAEEVGFGAAEMMAQDAEGADGVPETAGGLGGGEAIDEEGA